MKMMVCYDGTTPAKEALKVAQEHAQALGAEISVVAALVGDSQEQIHSIEKAEQDLAYARVSLKNANIPVETKLLTGCLNAGESLVEYAEQNEIDEIVIGIVKTSKVGKLIFGSTAQYVILQAPCPVLTVKE